MSAVELAAGAVLTLLLHATLLLGAVWFAERCGALKHPGWAELAWRLALFGALATTSLQVARTWPSVQTPRAEAANTATVVAPQAVAVPDSGDTLADIRAGGPMRTDAAVAVAGVAGSPAPSTRAVPPSNPGLALALPDALAFALVAVWLLALGAGALRVLGQTASVSRLDREVRRRGARADTALQADLRHVADVLALPAPPVHALDGLASPLLLPDGRLVLPAWVAALPTAQRRALLAHELAHLQRHDPRWRVLQRLAALPLAFHPLATHALSRLEALAEDACDARAARVAGSGRPLAECLAACLAHAGPRTTPVLAVAMADRPGPVVRRVRNLLESTPMSDRPVSPFLRRSAIALAIVAAIAVPGVAVTTFAADALADGITSHLSLDGIGDSHVYSVRDGDHALKVTMRGEVAFTDDESDVRRLGDGARVTVFERKGGDEREMRFSARDGKIQREYRVDGDVVPLDAEGRAWLAQVLPGVIRESGMDADARGRRILGKGGTPALLAEIARIRGDHARGRYLVVLFEHATLDDAQTAKAIDLAKAIDSDYELRRTLQAAASLPALSDARVGLLLDAATSIESDFELAELLRTVAAARPVGEGLLPAWRAVLAKLGSDFEHRRVLEALLQPAGASPAQVVVALDAAGGIGSDFERRQVLETAVRHLRADRGVAAAWFRAADGLGSDFERRSALEAAIAAGPVNLALADHVLGAVGGMGSDFEIGQVLAALAAKMPADAGLIARYRAQARRLGDHERGQAEKALDRFAI